MSGAYLQASECRNVEALQDESLYHLGDPSLGGEDSFSNFRSAEQGALR